MLGQSPKEYQKNESRVKDIIRKANGDVEKEKSLAKKQANCITNEYKAINRANVAKKLGNDVIFEIFFERAYELGSVDLMDYRAYIFKNLLSD